MTILQNMDNVEKPEMNQDLILTLNLNEEVIQFNKESERFTGYVRDEILHKNFNEILVPGDSVKQWKGLLDSIRQAIWIDNVILPLKTRNNKATLVSWTGFLVKDETGAGKNICIFGKPLKKDLPASQPSEPPVVPYVQSVQPEKKPMVESLVSQGLAQKTVPAVSSIPSTKQMAEELKISPLADASDTNPKESSAGLSEKGSKGESLVQNPVLEVQQPPAPQSVQQSSEKKESEAIIKHRVKKIMFASKKAAEQEPSSRYLREQVLTPLDTLGKRFETTSQKMDTMNETLTELSQKYEQITDRVTELEKKDKRWQKKQKILQEPEVIPEKTVLEPVDQQKDTRVTSKVSEDEPPEDEEFSFFSDPFGLKRQRRELLSKQEQLETRSKHLDAIQAQLKKERTIFNARVEEFSKWREKLMLLESAIEKRRQELIKQEDSDLLQKINQPMAQETRRLVREPVEDREPFSAQQSDESLEKISQSAVIIQRGILKQMNVPFMDMLGYPRDELMEKSFFDFIALEGLADVEKYYLDRLKGDAVSMYTTVFSTKENIKIPVEVTVKQTVYNGEKAEILIITCRSK